MKTFLLPLAFLFIFIGCASMQEAFLSSVCNKDGAFQKGYNDAQSGAEMNNYFSNECPSDTQKIVRESYKEGYISAKSNKGTQINIITGSSDNNWKCRESFGKKICGYNCIESFGQVKCAQVPQHSCIEAYGKIRCGLHCREEFGQIKCDEYE